MVEVIIVVVDKCEMIFMVVGNVD